MKEFVEKLIKRLNEKSKWVAYGNRDRDIGMTHKVVPFSDISDIVNELAEEYKATFMEKLLEAKRNCGEDSDCSECIFGQVQDRCYFAELQIKGGNNGWILCSERLPEEFEDIYIDGKLIDSDDRQSYKSVFGKTEQKNCFYGYYHNGKFFGYTEEGVFWRIDAIAWQPLPQPYKEEGE